MKHRPAQLDFYKTVVVATMALALLGAGLLGFAHRNQALAQTAADQHQTETILLPVADTYIASGEPDRKRPDLRIMWVGTNISQNLREQRSLLAFDLSAFTEASQIVRADLALTLSSTTEGDEPLLITANRLRGAWDENISWQEFSASINAGSVEVLDEAAQSNVGTEFTEVRWDVTELVRGWQQDGAERSNLFSLQLSSGSFTTERERGFWASECNEDDCGSVPGIRPQLRIQFSEPEATAEPLPTASPTASPTTVPTTSPAPTENAPLQPDASQGDAPAAAVSLNVNYLLDGSSPQSELPPEWQAGSDVEVTISVDQSNGEAPLDGLNLRSQVPFGTAFVNASNDGAYNSTSRMVEWTDIALPADGSQTLSMVLRRPQPIVDPRIVITRTGVSSIVQFDIATASGSDVQAEWNFDDGSPVIERPTQIFQSTQVLHGFPGPGRYQVSVWLHNESCRMLITEEVLVAEEGEMAEDGKVVASNRLTNTSSPSTDGTAQLPQCPEIAAPSVPQIVATWSTTTGQSQAQIANPRHQMFIPALQ